MHVVRYKKRLRIEICQALIMSASEVNAVSRSNRSANEGAVHFDR